MLAKLFVIGLFAILSAEASDCEFFKATVPNFKGIKKSKSENSHARVVPAMGTNTCRYDRHYARPREVSRERLAVVECSGFWSKKMAITQHYRTQVRGHLYTFFEVGLSQLGKKYPSGICFFFDHKERLELSSEIRRLKVFGETLERVRFYRPKAVQKVKGCYKVDRVYLEVDRPWDDVCSIDEKDL